MIVPEYIEVAPSSCFVNGMNVGAYITNCALATWSSQPLDI